MSVEAPNTAIEAPKSSLKRSLMGGASGAIRGLSSTGRALWARLAGVQGWKKHNFYEVFGWDLTITSQMLWEQYHRGGIAKRIVHAYPDATWGAPPEMKGPSAAWNTAWETLETDFKIWSIVHRLDKLSQLGQYSVLLLGTDSGRVEDPIKGKLTFLQPYGDQSARITRWVTDPTDPRFGLPLEYTINPVKNMVESSMGNFQPVGVPSQGSFRVHWSRVIHVCQAQLESDIFGIPLLYSVWNYLSDLNKVVGGAAESYWLTGNRGMQIDIDKELEMDEDDEAALNEEIEEYQYGLRRFMRTRGAKVTNLGSQVADPSGPMKAVVSLISGTTGIPQRILMGSEAAHNASTQDKGNWAEQVIHYRELTGTPNFLIPLVLGLMRIGMLPQAKLSKVTTLWPDAYVPSPLEKAQEANQRATATNNMAMAVGKVPNLMSVEEIREQGIGLGDKGKIVAGTKPEAPVPTVSGFGDATGDGGTAGGLGGTASGNKSTNGSDSNGSGDPRQDNTQGA